MFLTITALSIRSAAIGQIQLPEFSPEAKVTQTVGYTHVALRYGRPAARGRKIMGELVSFDRLWRTGAGKCTTLQFDQPVSINGRPVAPGTYALLTIPSRTQWTVMLNSDTSKLYGDPSEYNLKNEIVRVSVKPNPTGRFYESLSLEMDVVNDDAVLFLSWENTQISLTLGTNTYAAAEERIQAALKVNPVDVPLLSSVAYYYEMNNRDLSRALDYITKAMKLKDDWWYYRTAVDIEVKLKNYTAATDLAEKGIQFLRRTKPPEWEKIEQTFEEDIRKIAAMK